VNAELKKISRLAKTRVDEAEGAGPAWSCSVPWEVIGCLKVVPWLGMVLGLTRMLWGTTGWDLPKRRKVVIVEIIYMERGR
jgi:hypothetical protein